MELSKELLDRIAKAKREYPGSKEEAAAKRVIAAERGDRTGRVIAGFMADVVQTNLALAKRARKSWGSPGSRVRRKTEAEVFSAGKTRNVVVTLFPNGVIGLHLLGERTMVFIEAANAYRNATMRAKRKGKR